MNLPTDPRVETLIKMSTILCIREKYQEYKNGAIEFQIKFKYKADMFNHYGDIVILFDKRIKIIDKKYEQFKTRL